VAESKYKCEDCRFWVNRNIIGICHRFPQGVHKSKSEWCGEFKSATEEESRKPGRPRKDATPIT
jgi:hypothetical protein